MKLTEPIRRAPFNIGSWFVEPSLNQVSAAGHAPIRVRPQLMELLLCLAGSAGQVVSKQEILDVVWPDQAVSESALTACISELRQVFTDIGPERILIENIPKRGYRLLAPTPDREERAVPSAIPPLVVEAPEAGTSRSPLPRRTLLVLSSFLVIVGGAAAGWISLRAGASTSQPKTMQSLAVLPLANLTGDTKQDYFVDGLTEQLTTELARLPSLDIVSGTSASRYKHRTESAPEIARQLGNVDGLLEGGIARNGDHIRVMLDLVDARSDRQVWTHAYEGDLRDILDLYKGIAQSVASEIGSARISNPRPAAREPRVVKAESYDKFLQARYFSHAWQAGGCVKAERLLKDAIAMDPTFAEAYAELAYCNAFPDMLRRRGSDVVPAAHQAVARALELDETIPMVNAALGEIKWHQDFDWPAASMAFQRGLELNPNDPYTNFLYGEMLYCAGDPVRGLELLRQGMRLDPLSLDMKTAYGVALRLVGRPNEAIQQFKEILINQPDWNGARFHLSATYADVGRQDEAVSEYVSFLRLALVPDRTNAVADALSATYATQGWRAFLERDLALIKNDVGGEGTLWRTTYDRYRSPYWLAWRHARLGDRTSAIEQLELAFSDREHHIVEIGLEPNFKLMRADRRFQELRRRVGLDPIDSAVRLVQ